MGVNINVKSIEEVPEVMREFVSESDGAFVYDADKAFKALVEERNGGAPTGRSWPHSRRSGSPPKNWRSTRHSERRRRNSPS